MELLNRDSWVGKDCVISHRFYVILRRPFGDKNMWRLLLVLALLPAAAAATEHPILSLGSPAPNFQLPGVDGRMHQLSDYSDSPVLAVVFHLQSLPDRTDVRAPHRAARGGLQGPRRGRRRIQPNDPKAIRIDELDSSDMSDSLEEMKIRAEYKHLAYPYLYDGETQSVAEAYGPQATPHVFVFDRERRLRYEGRFDSSYRAELVKTRRRETPSRRCWPTATCPSSTRAYSAARPSGRKNKFRASRLCGRSKLSRCNSRWLQPPT